eukprot:gene21889-6495_t
MTKFELQLQCVRKEKLATAVHSRAVVRHGNMDHAHKVCGVSFSAYTEDEIRNLSIKTLHNPDSFDMMGHPMSGGLYDPAMGPI